MTWRLQDAIRIAVLSAAIGCAAATRAGAAALDSTGDINLGVRTYTAARIGTQDTAISIIEGNRTHNRQTFRSLTFPVSAEGHLRQNRFFAEVELTHHLDRLLDEGFGPFALLNDLPFKVRNFGYKVVYRGQYEGIYDYGPAEYRTAYQYTNKTLVPCSTNKCIDPLDFRSTLRNTAVIRNQLFQAYVEGEGGPLFVRFGRQILAWGETDVFRLLDNINPLDNSFGGFLIPLDERRVPLDMLRASLQIPPLPKLPFHDMYIEAYAAIDNAVAINPGIPNGSPWQLPNLLPSASTQNTKSIPPTNVAHTRGGFQFKFTSPVPVIEEATFGFAHYYTYLDVPAVQVFVSPAFPAPITTGPATGFMALAHQSVPVTQITGASANFAIPSDYVRYIGLSGEPIIRTELAYFRGEPRFTQSQLDPFVFGLGGCSNGGTTPDGQFCTGNFTCAEFAIVDGKRTCTKRVATGPRTGDSWNFVIGMDLNQFIRPINPNQSIFITTQFFYKHLNGAQPRAPIPPVGRNEYLPGQPHLFNGEVLPVPGFDISPDSRGIGNNPALEPGFVHTPINQYLQTLLIGTSYRSGQVVPAFGMFYDWSGSVVVQPQVTFSHDPFRFTMSYSYLAADTLKGASGISLLHDRDNVLFQFEYVL